MFSVWPAKHDKNVANFRFQSILKLRKKKRLKLNAFHNAKRKVESAKIGIRLGTCS